MAHQSSYSFPKINFVVVVNVRQTSVIAERADDRPRHRRAGKAELNAVRAGRDGKSTEANRYRINFELVEIWAATLERRCRQTRRR